MAEPRNWDAACPDWEARLLEGRSLVPELPLFEDQAARALRIFKRLRIPDVHGTPTMADACGEWFFPIVAAMFGSYDTDTKRRMIQEYFLLIPKGNSKTSYGGALMLTALIMNERPEAGFSLIAPTIKIAELAFDQAWGTINLDPELKKTFHPQRHIRTITHRGSGAALKIKAADTDVVTGGKDVGTMIDETHVFAKKSDAAAIFVELRGALAKRRDGFLFQTTTQSKEPPSGVFKRELERARAIRDGKRQLPLLPVLYEYPEEILEGHRWKTEPELWPLVNPNLGRSVDQAYLARELAEAEEAGADQMMLIASQHFNVEVGLRLTNDRWRGADYWQAASDSEACGDLEGLLDRCEVAVAAIDGGGLDDLAGLTVVGRERVTKRWLYWSHGWVQEDVLFLRKEIAPKLTDFAEAGELTLCREVNDDIAGMVEILTTVRASGLMPADSAIGVDPYGIGALVDAMAEAGFTIGDGRHGQVVAVRQGTNLMSAMHSMERKLKDGTLAHAGSRALAWCVENAKVEQRGNAVMISKEVSGKAKIDLLVASLTATKLMEANPEAAAAGNNGGLNAWVNSLKPQAIAA
jgi:phage terminase large subunit-like protein